MLMGGSVSASGAGFVSERTARERSCPPGGKYRKSLHLVRRPESFFGRGVVSPITKACQIRRKSPDLRVGTQCAKSESQSDFPLKSPRNLGLFCTHPACVPASARLLVPLP